MPLLLTPQTIQAPAPAPPPARAPASAPAWPIVVERLMAADSASYAPEDLKRQLTKHRDRLMAGVSDAFAAERGTRSRADHRAAAVRGAVALADGIRARMPFADVAYEVGGIVHEAARAFAPASADGVATAARTSSFLGYPDDPFQAPEKLVALPLPTGSAREAYDTGLTAVTRLLAWIWKRSGGDARLTATYPVSKGPYLVR